jgi:hypothetical protein
MHRKFKIYTGGYGILEEFIKIHGLRSQKRVIFKTLI